MRIIILEDNADRRTAMLEHIADCLPMFGVSFYETSDSMIQALQAAVWDEVALISLDNDLDPVLHDGKPVDAGDGVAVARYLVGQNSPASTRTIPPPLIIHSTNEIAAAQMQQMFSDANWPTDRVVRYDGESWIGEVWIQQARTAIIRNVSDRKPSPVHR